MWLTEVYLYTFVIPLPTVSSLPSQAKRSCALCHYVLVHISNNFVQIEWHGVYYVLFVFHATWLYLESSV